MYYFEIVKLTENIFLTNQVDRWEITHGVLHDYERRSNLENLIKLIKKIKKNISLCFA